MYLYVYIYIYSIAKKCIINNQLNKYFKRIKNNNRSNKSCEYL